MNMISVILPCYNSENFIANCLKSICNQTYKNLEILVVYLPSSDNTLQEITSIQDHRIKIIEQKEKTGPGGARNIGIDNANGEWIGFVESDDSIAPDFYSILISKTIDPDVDIVSGAIILRGRMWEHVKEEKYQSLENKYKSIKNGASFNKIFRADLIKRNNIRFAEGIRWEDNIFIFKSFYFARLIISTPDAIYYYNPDFWTEKYANDLRCSVIPAVKEVIAFAKNIKLSNFCMGLVKKRLVYSCAEFFLLDRLIYKELGEILDYPLFFRKLYWKKRFKQFRLRLKIFIFRKENK